MSDIKYIDGLIVKAPHEKAPDYVKCKLSIKRAELIEWLESQHCDWINADVKVSKNDKWYASVDDWKPEQRGGSSGSRGGAPQRQRPQSTKPAPVDGFADDDIPFISNKGEW